MIQSTTNPVQITGSDTDRQNSKVFVMFGGLQRFPMNGLLAFNWRFRAKGTVHTNPDILLKPHTFLYELAFRPHEGNSRYFKLYRAYSNSFNLSTVGNFFLALNSKRHYRSSGKENKSHCLLFTS